MFVFDSAVLTEMWCIWGDSENGTRVNFGSCTVVEKPTLKEALIEPIVVAPPSEPSEASDKTSETARSVFQLWLHSLYKG